MSELQNYPNHTSFSERRWERLDSGCSCGCGAMTDTEVAAELPTEVLKDELTRRGIYDHHGVIMTIFDKELMQAAIEAMPDE